GAGGRRLRASATRAIANSTTSAPSTSAAETFMVARRSAGAERERQPARDAEERRSPLDPVRDEGELAEPVDQRADRHLSLESGEVGAEAVVRAAAEREVLVRLALDVEAIRLGEDLRIAIRRREHPPDAGVPRDDLAAELDVGVEDARGQDHRPVVAQALCDRARDERGPGAQLRELVGMPKEGAHAVPDQADRRLEPGDQEPYRL